MNKFERRKKRYEYYIKIIRILRRAQEGPLCIMIIPGKNNQEYDICKRLSNIGMFNTKLKHYKKQNNSYTAIFIITNKGIRSLGASDLIIHNMEKNWSFADQYDREQHYCMWISIPAFLILARLLFVGASILWITICGFVMVSALLVSLENAISYRHANQEAYSNERQFYHILTTRANPKI